MKILAIGAHADDVELGCGGSLKKWASQGEDIHMLVVSDSSYSNPSGKNIRNSKDARKEAELSADLLNAHLYMGQFPCLNLQAGDEINSFIRGYIDEISPDLILTHWTGDAHQDHRVVAHSSIHASRHIPRVASYLSNWYTSEKVFEAKLFNDISECIEEKINLIQCFKDEFERTNGAWELFVKNQAAVWGQVNGCEYAEGFEVIRWAL